MSIDSCLTVAPFVPCECLNPKLPTVFTEMELGGGIVMPAWELWVVCANRIGGLWLVLGIRLVVVVVFVFQPVSALNQLMA